TPFGKMDSRNPEIIQLAQLLGRTPGSLAMKLVNFASLDPAITSTGRVGLSGASKGDREIWNEFHNDWEALAVESNGLLASLSPAAAATALPDVEEELLPSYEGLTKRVPTEVRIKQSFFRRAVLASYLGKCCMSAIAEPKLLIASHIVPWSKDKANRLNPRNGLCLSALHDRAFDLGLITVSTDYRVRVSNRLRKQSKNLLIESALCKIDSQPIYLPEKFRPEREFLEWHHEHRFKVNQ
ncbi:MAG: HNH endonuclease, partial [Betaproteobacteria bacterium]